MLTKLDNIFDSTTHEFIQSGQERITKKRIKEQQQSSVTREFYRKYFGDIEGPESNLLEY